MAARVSFAFVLYKDSNVLFDGFVRNYRKLFSEDLSYTLTADGLRAKTGVYDLLVSFVPDPVDRTEMGRVADFNPLFPAGKDIASRHKCHVIAAIKGNGREIERLRELTKVTCALMASYNALAVYYGAASLFYGKSEAESFARDIVSGRVPVAAYVHAGFYSHDNAFWAYTKGMDVFDRPELEICSDRETFQVLHETLLELAGLLCSTHRQLADGQKLFLTDGVVVGHKVFSETLQKDVYRFYFEEG